MVGKVWRRTTPGPEIQLVNATFRSTRAVLLPIKPAMSPTTELSPTMHKIVAGALLAIAFVVMASVFTPERSKAGGINPPASISVPRADFDFNAQHGISIPDAQHGQPLHSATVSSKTAAIVPAVDDVISTDPHEGLRSLGSIETIAYRVDFYSTAAGPRYSVYDRASQRELGVLLSAEQAHLMFPELQLPTADFKTPTHGDQPGPLMLAEPAYGDLTP
jgi:hypothetical protein